MGKFMELLILSMMINTYGITKRKPKRYNSSMKQVTLTAET